MPSISPGPLRPKPGPAPPPSGGGGGAPGKKADYVGVLSDGDLVYRARRFGRHKIDDLPGSVVSARLELFYVDKALPTGDVALVEIADFSALAPDDWGIAEIGTITAAALTPATTPGTKLSLDVTTAYNAAKAASRPIFAWKCQYETEDEGVGLGRWYRIGATGDVAPTLVLTTTAGQDLRVELLAIPLTVDLARADGLGTPAAAITAGDGATYPPLGEGVQLAATITGLVDDADGTYTGTPAAPIVQGPDLMHFAWRSADEGAGLLAHQVDGPAFVTARGRLADWFALQGGFTEPRDVREWMARIARSCRSFAYQDQRGQETVYTEPAGGSGVTPVRLVQPWEHGPLRLFPLPAATDAVDPVSRVEVFYGLDFLGLAGWQGHALIAAGETDPADTVRDAQAAEALARYGLRELGGVPATADPATGYEWVPLDAPGGPTGVRLRDRLWDRARTRPMPATGLEVALPRFALGWRLLDEFQLESYAFPSAAARMLLSATPFLGSTESAPVAYQARRARCQVRDLPRLTAEHGAEFPVLVTAQLLTWETV